MSTVQILRCLVNQRLTAAAEEVFEMFERTIADYEEKLRRSREENHRQQKLLSAVYNPEIHLDTADVEQLMVRKEEVLPEQQERSSSLNQEITEPPLIKEEQEELCISQDRGQLCGAEEDEINVFTFTPASVKSEEEDGEEPQSTHSYHTDTEESRDTENVKTGVSGEDRGGSEADRGFIPDYYLLPAPPNKTSHLFRPDAYQSGDWGESDEPQEGLNPWQNKDIAVHAVIFNTENTSVSSSGCAPQKKQQQEEKGEKPFGCSVCGKSYPSKNNLKQHMSRHATEKPFSCSICDRSFITKAEMVNHMRSHTGEKPFQCVFCGKHFLHKYYLSRHMRIHSMEKPFNCTECGKSFRSKSNLSDHMRIHAGDKPYGCSVCGKIFRRNRTLTDHMRIHTGEKPYSCSVCGKRFIQKSAFTGHMRVHTGEKPFSCNVCELRFTHQFQLRIHKCAGRKASEPLQPQTEDNRQAETHGDEGGDWRGSEPDRNSDPERNSQLETEVKAEATDENH
ncbi:zinc finger protein 502-like [Cheilinus undulatus]|uniref:zinc finger protein 502-like n=1 Tax=Cheilinus undulatus TaxID=241271 RepID=UPI001BD2B343|nr:zinc finger protein 502-like [Cheilinus undulatus]